MSLCNKFLDREPRLFYRLENSFGHGPFWFPELDNSSTDTYDQDVVNELGITGHHDPTRVCIRSRISMEEMFFLSRQGWLFAWQSLEQFKDMFKRVNSEAKCRSVGMRLRVYESCDYALFCDGQAMFQK